MPALIAGSFALTPAVRDFLSWWGRELAGLIPGAVRTAFGQRHGAVLISVLPDRTIVERTHRDGGERFADPRPLDALDDATWAQLTDIVDGASPCLLLVEPDVFVTILSLPAAAGGRIAAIVDLQIDELSPLPRDALVWGTGTPVQDSDSFAVPVVMARRDRVDAVTNLVGDRAGLTAAIGTMLNDRFVLLRRATSSNRFGRSWRLGLAIAGMIAETPLLIIVLAGLLTWRNDTKSAGLADAARAQLAAERRYRNKQATAQAIATLARIVPASHILDDLADHLPTDVTVRSLAVDRNGALTARIATADPDRLRPVLATDPLFRLTETDQLPEESGGRMQVTVQGRRR